MTALRGRMIVVAFAALGLMSIAAGGQAAPSNTKTTDAKTLATKPTPPQIPPGQEDMPQLERDYIAIYTDLRAKYDAARRLADKASIRATAQNRAHDVFGLNQQLVDWTGTIKDVHTTAEGGALWLTVQIAPDITLSTWTAEIFDQQHNTLIRPNSPLYKVLKEIPFGTKVKFSAIVIGARIASDDDMVERPQVISRFYALKAVE